jgi:hypothetical protein
MKPVGLQLYTLRRPFGEDPVGTLERIKQTGYDEVEFAAPLDMDFAPLAARMREIDLDCPSVHVGLAEITERPARVFEVARTLGCRFMTPSPVAPGTRVSASPTTTTTSSSTARGAFARSMCWSANPTPRWFSSSSTSSG